MRDTTFIPQEYDVFAGLDVSKKSIAATFMSHRGFIRSLQMPHSVKYLLNHVRKHFADQKIAFVYEAGPTGLTVEDCPRVCAVDRSKAFMSPLRSIASFATSPSCATRWCARQPLTSSGLNPCCCSKALSFPQRRPAGSGR